MKTAVLRARPQPPCLAVLLSVALASCAPVAVAIDAENGQVRVEIDGEHFTTVHYAATPRPHLFPVFGPGGIPMTRSWPMAEAPGEEQDHPHHQSLWFAHGSVNGYEFWSGSGRNERIEFGGRIELSTQGGATTLLTDYRWMAEEDVLVCTEVRRLVFRGDEDDRTIDFETTLTAGEEPLVFGDTKEGTMAMRLHPALRLQGEVAAGSMRNSEGVEGAACWGKRARWVECYGPVEGVPVGVALFDHPSNPRHPTWWHARDYGLVAANPFGVHYFEKKPAGTGDLRVEPGSSITFRYRILLHSGQWEAEWVQRAYDDWAAGE